MKRLLLFFFGLFITVFLLAHIVSAVYFATNKIQLYEGGKRITDSSVIHDRDLQSPVCKNGLCLVGQQYDTVTFYKTNQGNTLKYDEWINNWYDTHKGCEGFAKNEEAIRQALEDWRNSDQYKETQRKVTETNDVAERKQLWEALEPAKNEFLKKKGFDFIDNPDCKEINFSDYGNVYLSNIKNNSVYSATLKMPPPEGGEGCGDPGCIGGRIGNDRTLIVDLQRQTIKESKNPLSNSGNFVSGIIQNV